ncbi:metallophosphoesterase family protein [Cytobacillus purgationiresistens]|uniref:metallophosphoesterase family protein n=1 Tax=Cytobacillus purgationiresistens TaxID=863449 RepID=UPI0027D8EC3B|nr:hypothetical protein [Cytobacillus purgationiresistens]
MSKVNRKYSCPKLGVFGNHCHPSNFDDTEVMNIHENIVRIKGLTIAGFGGAPKYKDKLFGQHTEEEAAAFVTQIYQQNIDILITHSNPAYENMTLDHAHRGFTSFNTLINNNKINHLFHGHLHDPFTKNINEITIHSVYPFIETEI